MIHKYNAKKVTKPERLIENEILNYLISKGVFCWKNTTGGFFDGKRFRKHSSKYAINGTSDILGILSQGQFLAIEVKSDKGIVSKEQDAFISTIKANGGIAFIARSLDDVMCYF